MKLYFGDNLKTTNMQISFGFLYVTAYWCFFMQRIKQTLPYKSFVEFANQTDFLKPKNDNFLPKFFNILEYYVN